MKYVNKKTGITVEYDGDIAGVLWMKADEAKEEILNEEKEDDPRENETQELEAKDEKETKKVVEKTADDKIKKAKGKTVIKP